jgi:YbbR domain-containing protein
MGLARRIGIIVTALMVALILFTYVHLAGSFEVDLDIPLEVTSPPGYALATDIPQKIHTKLRGPGWRLILMEFTNNTKFNIDLTTRDPQTLQTKIFLTQNDFQHSPVLPSDVTLLKIEPDSLGVAISQEMTKRLPIDVRLDIQPAIGYTVVDEPLLAPVYVTVKGSNHILDSLRFFPTKVLHLKNVRESFTHQIELSDTLHEAITSRSANMISVRIEVQAVAEKEFKDIPIAVEALPPDREMMLIPGSLSLVLRGGVDALAKLDPGKIRASIMYDGSKLDSTDAVKPVIQLPKGIEFLSSEPSEVKFVIRKKEKL